MSFIQKRTILLLSCLNILVMPLRASAPLISYNPNFSSLPGNAHAVQISNSPYIVCISNFISDEEAEFLKKAAQPLLKKSLVVGSDSIGVANPGRTSSSAFLHTVKSKHITNITKRAANVMNTRVNQVEGLQVVYYKNLQKYDPHYDYFNRSHASSKIAIGKHGQRVATFLVYLNDIGTNDGGETFFPKVNGGLKIKPQKNMAVLWYNVLPNGKEDENTLHAGLPIIKGEKYAMNIWIRDSRLIEPYDATQTSSLSV